MIDWATIDWVAIFVGAAKDDPARRDSLIGAYLKNDVNFSGIQREAGRLLHQRELQKGKQEGLQKEKQSDTVA